MRPGLRRWDGLRGAYWKTRAPETEKPLEAFLQAETENRSIIEFLHYASY